MVYRQKLSYLSLFSQVWFPTVQEVLHADWQEVWHSPQPPFFRLSFSVFEVRVLTLFMIFQVLSEYLRGSRQDPASHYILRRFYLE